MTNQEKLESEIARIAKQKTEWTRQMEKEQKIRQMNEMYQTDITKTSNEPLFHAKFQSKFKINTNTPIEKENGKYGFYQS